MAFLHTLLLLFLQFHCPFLVLARWNGGIGGEQFIAVPPMQKLFRAQLEFSFDLYRSVAGSSSNSSSSIANGSTLSMAREVDNLVLSPYSVMNLLSMLYLGSSGSTSDQLRHVLHFDSFSFVEVHRSYKKILEGIRHGSGGKAGGSNLTIANKIFVQKGINVSRVYSEKLLEFYDAILESVDFALNASFARDLINMWIKVHTRGKIESLLDSPPLPTTKLLLANAIFFQGFWLYKFDRKKTFEMSTFRVSITESLTVPMMVAKMKVAHGYIDALRCNVLELPYVDRRLSMFILLPDDVEGLAVLERKLTSETVSQLLSALKEDTVNVRIPRFRLESRLWLRESLVKLGLVDLFVEGLSDLSGLTNDVAADLFVSEVTHRATISVTEEGSEAAAASTLDVERIGVIGESYFEADHPFLFFIWDYQINVSLFIGRVVRPVEART